MLVVLVLVLTVAACSSSSAGPTKSAVGGTMTVRVNGDWDNFDIQKFASANSWFLSTALYDRLVAIGPGGKLLPYLAKSWKTTPTSITFNLHADATCADGTPVTATVVANSFKRLFSGLGGGPAALARYFGKGPYTVSADNAGGVFTVNLGSPFGDAIYGFAQSLSGVICPAGLADTALMMEKSTGSGAFVIESAKHGDQMVLRVRPEWKWGAYGVTARTPGFPDTLIFKVVINDTTAANLLVTGGLDVARVDGVDVKRLHATMGLSYVSLTPFTNFVMAMNELPGRSTADETVRQALMTAVDPKEWNLAANQGFGKTGSSFLSGQADCYEPATAGLMPKPSIDKAKSILTSAGWTAGPNGKLQKNGVPLVVNVVANNSFGAGPEYLSEQFNKVGITSNLKITEYNINAQAYLQGDFDVGFPTLSAATPAPSVAIAVISGPAPPTGVNIPRVTDSYLEQEVSAALTTTGPERCQHWSNVQRRYLEKHHLLPLAGPETTWFARGIDLVQNFYLEPTSLKRRS